ncbi:hypothetical protein MAR_012190 [Mya arenaria]|uniref:Uncharacterized protein n=1 Tax=Mya arenaria TaxID=6604 RepID=A0ABY7G5C4_MYAAR|nr:hypothetical protein MAR_012190 [Mya arenaria]
MQPDKFREEDVDMVENLDVSLEFGPVFGCISPAANSSMSTLNMYLREIMFDRHVDEFLLDMAITSSTQFHNQLQESGYLDRNLAVIKLFP